MKTIITLCIFLLSCTLLQAQSYFSDFQDGTLQNWTNTDGSTATMSVEDGDDGFSKHLRKLTDGSSGAVGEMAIKNNVDYYGDYNCYDTSGIDCLGWVEFYIKNENSFDVNLRMGLLGANGTKLVSNVAIQTVNYPEGSDWYFYEMSPDPTQFVVVEGSGSVEDTMEDIVELRLVWNEDVSFEGMHASGTMIIDQIFYVFLLSSEDNPLSNVALFPSPANEILNLKMPAVAQTEVKIYNISGKKVSSHQQTAQLMPLDVSQLSSGIYFAEIATEEGTILKKFVKQ